MENVLLIVFVVPLLIFDDACKKVCAYFGYETDHVDYYIFMSLGGLIYLALIVWLLRL